MSCPTVQVGSRLHIASGAQVQDCSAIEAASSTIHLVDVADGRHTLCGLALSRVLTGGYCEHLDGNLNEPQFERTVFARDGQEAEPCEECLSRQPSVLVSSLEDC